MDDGTGKPGVREPGSSLHWVAVVTWAQEVADSGVPKEVLWGTVTHYFPCPYLLETWALYSIPSPVGKGRRPQNLRSTTDACTALHHFAGDSRPEEGHMGVRRDGGWDGSARDVVVAGSRAEGRSRCEGVRQNFLSGERGA